MTAGELMAKLAELSPDALVVSWYSDCACYISLDHFRFIRDTEVRRNFGEYDDVVVPVAASLEMHSWEWDGSYADPDDIPSGRALCEERPA